MIRNILETRVLEGNRTLWSRFHTVFVEFQHFLWKVLLSSQYMWSIVSFFNKHFLPITIEIIQGVTSHHITHSSYLLVSRFLTVDLFHQCHVGADDTAVLLLPAFTSTYGDSLGAGLHLANRPDTNQVS